jgi:putative oxidoreductase
MRRNNNAPEIDFPNSLQYFYTSWTLEMLTLLRSDFSTLSEVAMKYAPLVGRILFSAIFLAFGMNHLTDAGSLTGMVPDFLPAKTAVVMITGIVIIAAGLMVLLGYRAKLAGQILFVFMLLTTFTVWAGRLADGGEVAMTMFMKDLALAGASLLIAHFGAGPMSLDEKAAG